MLTCMHTYLHGKRNVYLSVYMRVSLPVFLSPLAYVALCPSLPMSIDSSVCPCLSIRLLLLVFACVSSVSLGWSQQPLSVQ